MPPSLKRWLDTACCTLGLALSLHLALLKYYSLPCIGPGGCHAIIYSAYGTVLGLPVGVYGAVLWTGAILVRDRTKRGSLLMLLAAGSAIFMGIQFLVLHGFCLYCTLHAVVAWIALGVYGEAPNRGAVPLSVALALGGFWIARTQAAAHAETGVVVPGGGPLASAPAGLPWLGPVSPRSPALVISLNCAACLDLLGELTRQKYADLPNGPAIYFKVSDENREVTTTFVAAILAQPGAKRDVFLSVSAVLLSMQDRVLSAPQAAAQQLAAMFPNSTAQRDQAQRLLRAQEDTLHRANIGDTTPLFVPIAGRPRAFFKTDELFAH